MKRQEIVFKYPNDPANLENLYKNTDCFLICGGPSLLLCDLTLLNNRGILVGSVNNSGALVRSNFWFSVDHPKSFHSNIWFDPQVLKFIPDENLDKSFLVHDKTGHLQPSNKLLFNLPSVLTYRRNKDFHAEKFLEEPTINWGNEGSISDSYGNKGARSVMYPAFRILYYLGIRRLFLLGCDFNMEVKQPYAFSQKKHEGGCRTNNQAYTIHNTRFTNLRPYLEKKGFKVYNCNKESKLTAFEYISYEKAIEICTAQIISKPILSEMYG